MAKYILVNGAYSENYVPVEKFSTRGWARMLEYYRLEPPEQPQRPVMWLSLYDDTTGEAYDSPDIVRKALQEVGKRVDQLSMSILPGWEERPLLGKPGEESGLLPQMPENMEDHTEP